MKPQMRAALEAELGRSLRDDEEVSIMAFEPHEAPTGEARRDAARGARRRNLNALQSTPSSCGKDASQSATEFTLIYQI